MTDVMVVVMTLSLRVGLVVVFGRIDVVELIELDCCAAVTAAQLTRSRSLQDDRILVGSGG